MPSPFPGMDPFIERSGLWADFHFKFIGEIERELSGRVPARYLVRTGERYFIDVYTAEDVAPDVQAYRVQSDMTVVRVGSPTPSRRPLLRPLRRPSRWSPPSKVTLASIT